MAISNFIPEIWAASVLANLRNQLVYGQAGVINRDYEGDIARAGDTVHITSFTDPAVRSYSRNTDITWDTLTDDGQTLTIDQSKYFAFSVDDLDKRQALNGFMDNVTVGASYNLSNAADTFLSTTMAAGVDSGNELGAVTVDSATPSEAYDLVVEIRTLLVKSNTPATGRFVIVPPELYAVLLHDDRFVRCDASGSTDGLRNGMVGRIAGFDVIESNTVPESGGAFTVLAGHGIATTYAEQIASVEAIRRENQFGDGVKGLHLYGARVVRPKNLASAVVTINSDASSSSSSSSSSS